MAQELAQSFVQQYYQAFDANRASLAGLYQPHSKLHFEGELFQGPAIVQKLVSLKLDQCRHVITTLDVQDNRAFGPAQGILIFVTGDVFMSENPVKFSQVFLLHEAAPGQWYVMNDIFRLNYG